MDGGNAIKPGGAFAAWFLKTSLLANTELRDDDAIPLDIHLFQVVEQIAAMTDHFEQAAAGVVILGVNLQMRGELVDAIGQDRDLNLGRAGIGFMKAVFLDDFSLFFFTEHCFHLNFKFAFVKAGGG